MRIVCNTSKRPYWRGRIWKKGEETEAPAVPNKHFSAVGAAEAPVAEVVEPEEVIDQRRLSGPEPKEDEGDGLADPQAAELFT